MACKVIKTSSGGCTHFITTPDPEGGVMTVGFGQGVVSVIKHSRLYADYNHHFSCMEVYLVELHGFENCLSPSVELGLGSDSAKSATKPQKIIPLSGVDMIEYAVSTFNGKIY